MPQQAASTVNLRIMAIDLVDSQSYGVLQPAELRCGYDTYQKLRNVLLPFRGLPIRYDPEALNMEIYVWPARVPSSFKFPKHPDLLQHNSDGRTL